jgi:hypothetical protein
MATPLLLEIILQLEYVERYVHPFMFSYMRAASHVVRINATFLFFNDANAMGGWQTPSPSIQRRKSGGHENSNMVIPGRWL